MPAPRLTLRDISVVALVTAGLAAFSGAMVDRNRETANRVKCASNLKQVGMAMMLYANENRGAYPRTTYKPADAPVWGTGYADAIDEAVPTKNSDPFADEKTAAKDVLAVKPQPNDVTAALFLLLRTQDLVPEVFVCPSTRLKRFGYDGKGAGALEYTNFPGKEALAAHLSYSYQNPYPSPKAIQNGFRLNNAITAEFATMADMNPGTDDLTTVTIRSTFDELRKANSLNHQSDGQNILFGDGHVEFNQNPLVGVRRDNIYLANDAVEGKRREGEPAFAASAADADDSILLPTAADIGQTLVPEAVVPAPDPAALLKQIKGTFAKRDDRGRPVVLTINDATLTAVSGPASVTYAYKIAGTRGTAIVLILTATDTPAVEAELNLTEQSLVIDADEFTGALNGGWARRAQP